MDRAAKFIVQTTSAMFGEQVRLFEDNGLETGRRNTRILWVAYLKKLRPYPELRILAVRSYSDAYSEVPGWDLFKEGYRATIQEEIHKRHIA